MKNKRGSIGIWVLVIVILVIISVVVYFLFSGDSASIVNGTTPLMRPPALPA